MADITEEQILQDAAATNIPVIDDDDDDILLDAEALDGGGGATDAAAAAAAAPAPVHFEATQQQQREHAARLAEAEQAHRARAARFGTEYKPPPTNTYLSRTQRLAERVSKMRGPGFVTGIDLEDEQEQRRRQARAERFGLAQSKSSDEALKKRLEERAKKFDMPVGGLAARSLAGSLDEMIEEQRSRPQSSVPVREAKVLAGADVARRTEVLCLHGVDVMTTKDCLNYFVEFGPSMVEWINDSSCNVVFEDPHTAWRALVDVSSVVERPSEDLVAGGLPDQFWWREARSFFKNGRTIPLWVRIASIHDVKPKNAKKSRYTWIKNRDQVLHNKSKRDRKATVRQARGVGIDQAMGADLDVEALPDSFLEPTTADPVQELLQQQGQQEQ